MKRLLAFLIVSLLSVGCAHANLTYPPAHVCESCAYGEYCIGVDLAPLAVYTWADSGVFLFDTYRETVTYGASPWSTHCTDLSVKVHPYACTHGTSESSAVFWRQTQSPAYDFDFWSIDCHTWRSTEWDLGSMRPLFHNGMYEVVAESDAEYFQSGGPAGSIDGSCSMYFVVNNLLITSLASPSVLVWNGSACSIAVNLSDGGSLSNTELEVRIYPVVGDQPIRTITQTVSGAGPHTVVWDGDLDNSDPAPYGLYAYTLMASHAEREWEYIGGGTPPVDIVATRTGAASTDPKFRDRDLRNSDLKITGCTIQEIGSGSIDAGKRLFRLTYTLSKPASVCGLRVYGSDLSEMTALRRTDLPTSAAAHTADVQMTMADATRYYFAIHATDAAQDNKGHQADKPALERGVVVDSDELSRPVVTDQGATTGDGTRLRATWTPSGFAEYEYAIGTQDSDTGSYVIGWTSTGTATAADASFMLTDGQIYYFYVKARNSGGCWTKVGCSDGITYHRVVHVDSSKPNNLGSGLSWDAAKRDVQEGIAEAASGQAVWVKAGNYQQCITLKSGVKLLGGFEGDEVDSSSRDWVAHVTTLDGSTGDTSVVTVPSSATSPATEINGFVITNGKGRQITSPVRRNGGGIYCDVGCAVTIACNKIIGNCTNNGVQDFGTTPGYQYSGAGIYCEQSYAAIANNIIAGNGHFWHSGSTLVYGGSDTYGGGICTNSGRAIIANNTICRNVANSAAGILAFEDLSNARIANNVISHNKGAAYQGIHKWNSSAIIAQNCAYPATNATYPAVSGEMCEDPLYAGDYDLLTDFSVPLTGMDFHLHYCSPCIEAAAEAYAPDDDYENNARPLDGNEDCVSLPDIGAYEFNAATWGIADDWPMFMHDPRHTGLSRASDALGETLSREWVADLPTANTSRGSLQWTVQISPGVYVDHPRPLYGNTSSFEHPYIDSSPVVVENRVVVGTWDSGDYVLSTGSVKAFDAANGGAVLWTADDSGAMGGVASTPCIADGRVYVGSANGCLYCLDLVTGYQKWKRQTTDRSAAASPSRIISSPVVHNGVVYITNETSKIYAFTADDNGTQVGSAIELPIADHGITDLNKQMICGASSPAIAIVGANTYLLVGSDDACLYRIRLSDRQIAELSMPGCVESSPSVSGNYAYVGVTEYWGHNLHRITVENSQTGAFESAGSWALQEESRATPSLAYGFVYNGVDTGHTFYKLCDPESDPSFLYLTRFAATGGSQYNYFVGSAAHTAGGLVYTGNDNGTLYVLRGDDLVQVVADTTYLNSGFICSSPAIGYRVRPDHSRWVFITTRANGGKLVAYTTARPTDGG